jgi:hypothetical protein
LLDDLVAANRIPARVVDGLTCQRPRQEPDMYVLAAERAPGVTGAISPSTTSTAMR